MINSSPSSSFLSAAVDFVIISIHLKLCSPTFVIRLRNRAGRPTRGAAAARASWQQVVGWLAGWLTGRRSLPPSGRQFERLSASSERPAQNGTPEVETRFQAERVIRRSFVCCDSPASKDSEFGCFD